MKPEQQRIAIAEACEIVSRDQWGPLYKTARGVLRDCPDYLNDLNAMQEVERAMNNNDWWKFVEYLTNICGGGIALGVSATAAQRAEAFLKTVGKWEEEG
jgi:hypothetical protein